MKKIALLLMVGLFAVSGLSQAQTAYYGEPATISGKLLKIKSLHPNPAFSGETQIAVALNQQLNVDGEEGLVKTKLIQLVDSNDQRYNQFFKNEHKAITVKCSELFRAETAHHTTKVLCFVESVKYK
ncbi:DUF4431 domain-containing protein [Acinetobacter guillouiae]|uniref:DUF4431 domain-containing protein n=1 Tax=Acinetobacter guillouiae TaxID=106649 RepID=UPI0026541013|nr:DUF4431 domain-containing protein [Chryseobacterium sp.]